LNILWKYFSISDKCPFYNYGLIQQNVWFPAEFKIFDPKSKVEKDIFWPKIKVGKINFWPKIEILKIYFLNKNQNLENNFLPKINYETKAERL